MQIQVRFPRMLSYMTIILFFAFIGCTQSLTVSVPKRSINVTKGDTVILPCSFMTNQPTTNLLVQWTFYSTSSLIPQQAYYYQSGMVVISQQFKDRLKMLNPVNTTMNATITISNMQLSDTGTYTCEVHNAPDIQGTTSASILVRVLEKPSVPFCAVHGNVELSHLVTLTCHSEKGSPTPTYTWTKLHQGRSRRVLGVTDVKTGIMYIRNISQFEFGEYQCNASNVLGFATCTVELQEELNGGVIAGVVIGAILGAIFIVLLVWFITHKLKTQKYRAVKVNQENKQQSHRMEEYEASPPNNIADQGEEEA